MRTLGRQGLVEVLLVGAHQNFDPPMLSAVQIDSDLCSKTPPILLLSSETNLRLWQTMYRLERLICLAIFGIDRTTVLNLPTIPSKEFVDPLVRKSRQYRMNSSKGFVSP